MVAMIHVGTVAIERTITTVLAIEAFETTATIDAPNTIVTVVTIVTIDIAILIPFKITTVILEFTGKRID